MRRVLRTNNKVDDFDIKHTELDTSDEKFKKHAVITVRRQTQSKFNC
jgi:hypothetical protein